MPGQNMKEEENHLDGEKTVLHLLVAELVSATELPPTTNEKEKRVSGRR